MGNGGGMGGGMVDGGGMGSMGMGMGMGNMGMATGSGIGNGGLGGGTGGIMGGSGMRNEGMGNDMSGCFGDGMGDNVGGGDGNGTRGFSNGSVGSGTNSMQRNNRCRDGIDGDSFGGDSRMDPLIGEEGGMQGGGMCSLDGHTFDTLQGSQEHNSDMSTMMRGLQNQGKGQQQSNERPQTLQDDQGDSSKAVTDTDTSRQDRVNPKPDSLVSKFGGPSNSGMSQRPGADIDPQERLRRLKEEIAQREREAKELLAASSGGNGMKREANGDDESGNEAKRVKNEAA